MNDSLTPNQKYALECIEPGVWFVPDEYSRLVNIHTRDNTCRILERRGILVNRATLRQGWVEVEYMLPPATVARLGIKTRSEL